MRKFITPILMRLTLLLCICLTPAVWGLGDKSYVSNKSASGAMPLVNGNDQASLYVDANDFKGVVRAVGDLQKDVMRVADKQLSIVNNKGELKDTAVIIGTLGKSALIDELIKQGKIDTSAIDGVWDAYHIELIKNPVPGVSKALVIAGANKRGTTYGIYDLSEQIGVSPWYYWADVTPEKQNALYILKDTKIQDAPKVKYRGIFLNDEAPALTNWVQKNHGNYNHEFYVKVFELLLRLKANFMWPAMWNNAFADDDPLNMILADEYGIVMSTSHHEPMMRADKEWNRYGEGPWEYSTNPKNLYKFWEDGAKRNKNYESMYTLGMRGQEDKPMSEGDNIELLETIVKDQREILAKVFDDRPISEVPQVWCLYKEVQGFYERGMRVPDDVTLLWTDDNWGNIRRLPTPKERGRLGGAGVYYHFDYVGGPRSYRWINTNPIAKVWEQMNLAYQYEANTIWITNVGDLKPMEFPTEFFLRMAWNPEAWPKERLIEFGQLWAAREFGEQYAQEIERLISGYTRHNGRRKPELMEPETYSLLYYREAERVQDELNELVERAEALYKKMPEEKKSAFFQLVLHPVKATATITDMNIAIAKNRLYGKQYRSMTNTLGNRAKALFNQDAALKDQYHSINDGKWEHFMDQPHIGYVSWQNPERDQLPAIFSYPAGEYAEMGMTVEGVATGWPEAVSTHWPHQGSYQLDFDINGQQERWIEIYNRGTLPFDFNITVKAPWIKLSQTEGSVKDLTRIVASIDWKKVPEGKNNGSISIKGTGWASASVYFTANKPSKKLLKKAKGFIEADGYLSLEAGSFSKSHKAGDYGWEVIPNHGRTQSSISVFPVTNKSFETIKDSPALEYPVTFFTEGKVKIKVYANPTWPLNPGQGLRYAVAIGDDDAKIMDLSTGFDSTDKNWDKAVSDGVLVQEVEYEISKAGPSKLKLYGLDPAVTIQKIVVDTGGLKPSYLGPPESPYKR